MKIKRIKKPKRLPFIRFEEKIDKYKFTAKIYEDGSGWYEGKEDRQGQFAVREDGNIEDWIEDLDAGLDKLHLLYDFLDEVRLQMNETENSLKEK